MKTHHAPSPNIYLEKTNAYEKNYFLKRINSLTCTEECVGIKFRIFQRIVKF